MHIYCCWKASKANFKDYHVSPMSLYVLLDFSQYQIYFLSFYKMNLDCMLILPACCELSTSSSKSVDFIKLQQVCENQTCCDLIFVDLLQVAETTCIKLADKKSIRPYSEGDFRSCCCPTSGTTFNLQNSLDFYMLNSISVVVTRAYLQFFRILRSISLVFNLCSRHCSFYILHVILIY